MQHTVLPPAECLRLLKGRFSEQGSPEVAEGQSKYMRNLFPFYGVKTPARKQIIKNFLEEYGYLKGKNLKQFCMLAFADEYREMQYVALELLEKRIRKQDTSIIDFLEELITTKSWWDTVDWLSKLVGIAFQKHPEQMIPTIERWMKSGNFWLQRTCIICQRFYKLDTNVTLLFSCIRQVAHSKEFFLQKGAGWALREYSKVQPRLVQEFIQQTPLAPLTIREGRKWMQKYETFA